MKTKIRILAQKTLENQSFQKNLYALDKKVCNLLKEQIKAKRAKKVLLFYPMKHEVNVSSLIWDLKKQRVRVFLPRIKNEEMFISELRLPLSEGKYKILHSSTSQAFCKPIDFAVIPVLGVDCDGGRVGFGKGYYDRFFVGKLPKPYIIFVSRKLIYSRKKVTNHYDIKANVLISSKVFLKFEGKNGIRRGRFYFLNSCCNHWVISCF